MKVDAGLLIPHTGEFAAAAKLHENLGYDGVFSAETAHDPFLPLAVAADRTARVDLGTAIAVAFARSPLTLASLAHDLQRASGGRFLLGLGSQIKPHIEKRFSMPWSHPAARMRELILAVRAIWSCWNDRVPLEFRGRFYTHTLMTPHFDPGPNPSGPPRILLAAVGEKMTEVAGDVADGLLVHAFTTKRYLNEVTVPIIDRCLAARGVSRRDFELSIPALIVTGDNEEEFEQALVATRQQIAFYGSTPAYRPVLERHGWGDLQTELNTLSKSDRTDKYQVMSQLIDDEILGAFAVVGEPDRIAPDLKERFSGVIDRLTFYPSPDRDAAWRTATMEALRTV